MRITIGVIIAIILIFVWYRQDHPEAFAPAPAKVGYHYVLSAEKIA